MKIAILSILALATVGSIYWWIAHPRSTSEKQVVMQEEVANSIVKPPRTAPLGMSEYRDETYGFQMFVPEDMQITAFKEAGDATTFTFTSGEKVFQLFVTPYGERKIAEAKFKEDIPSGVIQNVTTGVIDGSDTAFFDSTQAGLGDTREVWFVGKGLLFEFTTYRNLGSWMEPIVKTLEFL